MALLHSGFAIHRQPAPAPPGMDPRTMVHGVAGGACVQRFRALTGGTNQGLTCLPLSVRDQSTAPAVASNRVGEASKARTCRLGGNPWCQARLEVDAAAMRMRRSPCPRVTPPTGSGALRHSGCVRQGPVVAGRGSLQEAVFVRSGVARHCRKAWRKATSGRNKTPTA